MNISSILSDGSAPQKRTSSQASTPDGSRFISYPPPNGGHMGPGAYPPPRPESHTPLHAPLSTTPGLPQSTNLTPLKTPAGGHAGNQYPFPHQPARPSDAYATTTPVNAHPAYVHQHAHQSPSVYGPGGPVPILSALSTSSHSPTPSSHLSQTPHSMRHSPVSTFSQPPSQAPPPQQYHASQPSTPLGPPPLLQRTSNPLDRASPLHQRTLSSASSSLPMGSPAQHHPSIGNLLAESPSTHTRPPSHSGRNSEQPGGVDRERSVSVSPKTVVHPRPSSMSSRHSSQQEVHSARSSLQPSAGAAPATVSTASDARTLVQHAASDVTHVPRPQSNAYDKLSSSSYRSPIEHHSQKLGMHHLLSPNNLDGTAPNVNSGGAMPPDQRYNAQIDRQQQAPLSASPTATSQSKPAYNGHSSPGPQPLLSSKRPANDEAPSEPPTKRLRKRKYTNRPVWAQVSPHNQSIARAEGSLNIQTRTDPHVLPHAQQPVAHAQHAHLQEQPHHNGEQQSPHANGQTAHMPPWRQDPPLDGDLMLMRSVLGPWEKSMKWHTPIPSMVDTVQDWLFRNLEVCADVGNDPLQGAIEIEAKIGTLINHSDGQRCNLPVASATVIHPAANRNYRFESQMNMKEHRQMNDYLNAITAATQEKGRVPMAYQHLRENDSFRLLSEIGLRALPQTAHKRPFGRELKLRSTTEDASGKIKARIVKIPLDDLHIFSPQDPYDCRISMNLEVNLNRDDIDPDALTVEPTPGKPAPPDRHKDRLSYRHLAYTVDLTRVDVKGLAPKFELELELDAKILREQMHRFKVGAPNAFSNVVEGFLDNCAILMRHRAL